MALPYGEVRRSFNTALKKSGIEDFRFHDLRQTFASHLGMAGVTAFAHIDVAAGKLERRIGPHALDLLDRALEIEEGSDLDKAADRDHQQDADDQDDRVLLEDLMPFPE